LRSAWMMVPITIQLPAMSNTPAMICAPNTFRLLFA
jgi:hypothetical protein